MLTSALLRKKNLLAILELIKKSGVISRPEIARQTNLSIVTVNTLIIELMKTRIIIEEGLADSIGGRKAALYRFNEKAYSVIGINVRFHEITIDIFDLHANTLCEGIRFPITGTHSVEPIIAQIISAVSQLSEKHSGKSGGIIGIGIALPGHIDSPNGVICRLTKLKEWVNIPLGSIVEAETKIKTYLERDTNAHLSFLRLFGFTDSGKNVVYLCIGEGAGGALLIDDKIYHGEKGLAGELGHTTLNPNGPRCVCGNTGCMEVYTSNAALVTDYSMNVKQNGSDSPFGNITAFDEFQAVLDISRIAAKGGVAAKQTIDRACLYIRANLNNIMNTLNPSVIIVECYWLRHHRELFDEIVGKVFENTTFLDRCDAKIILNPVEDIFTKAPAAIVLDRLFSDADSNPLLA